MLDGYKIVLVHADSQGKPDVGKAEAERLFNQEGVWAIIGSYNSAVSKPASLVAETLKRIFMCGASSSAALTQRDMNLFFRLAPTDETESVEFVEVLKWLNDKKNADIKTIGVIYENSEFGKHAAARPRKPRAPPGSRLYRMFRLVPAPLILTAKFRHQRRITPTPCWEPYWGPITPCGCAP